MSNSVKIPSEVKTDFDTIKNNRAHKYMVYRIEASGGTHSVVKEREALGTDMTQADEIEALLEEELPEDKCRFVVLDFRYMNPYDAQVDKFVLLIW